VECRRDGIVPFTPAEHVELHAAVGRAAP
jgi:hypothetical protein